MDEPKRVPHVHFCGHLYLRVEVIAGVKKNAHGVIGLTIERVPQRIGTALGASADAADTADL
jgi:hypothetical protein